MSVRLNLASFAFLGGLLASGSAHADLIGNWVFNSATPLLDTTGNFGNLTLEGDASVSNGGLVLTGSGTTSTGYAETSSYSGPSITDKTMVVWGTMQGLANTAYAGALMSISAANHDQFDAIDYGEVNANTWMNGSTYFQRTQAFSPGYTETSANLNQLVEIAFTYASLGNGNEEITGYVNGVDIGSYESGNVVTWDAGNTIVGFGPRSLSAGAVSGGINATVDAAQLYDTALTQSQIEALSDPETVPEPTSLAIIGGGLLGIGYFRRRR